MPPSFCTRPDIHGDLVVFTCEGDLWLGSISSGDARRITSAPGAETNAHFSPDGSLIAYNAQYDGGNDVYVMPVGGGAPRRLTYEPGEATVQGWTPDGKFVLYRSDRQIPYGWVHRLYRIPVEGGVPIVEPIPHVEFASERPDGAIAFVPSSKEWANWFRYQAGQTDIVWTFDPATKKFKKLTAGKYVVTNPVWCGGELYAVSEASGVCNLAKLNSSTGADALLTHFVDGPVLYPGTDGKRIVFQHGPGLGIYDPATNRASDLNLDLHSDRIHMLPMRAGLGANAASWSIGPTGKRVAVEARGQIVTVAAGDGEIRILENSPASRSSLPSWSTDGKKIAFVSDRTGENEIWLAPSNGGAATQLTHGLNANLFAPVWCAGGAHIVAADRAGRLLLIDTASGAVKVIDTSTGLGSYDAYHTLLSVSPDGKFVAFDHCGDNWLQSVYIYEIATGKSAPVSGTDVNSYSPTFTADGKFVAYLADRTFEPFIAATQKIAYDRITKVNLVALAKGTPSPFLPKPEDEGVDAPKPAAADKNTKVDFDGLLDRVIDTPIEGGRYTTVFGIAGHVVLLDHTSPLGFSGPSSTDGKLVSFDLTSKDSATLAEGISSATPSFNGEKLLIARGTALSIIDPKPGAAATAVKLDSYAIEIDPAKEWKEVFQESWRMARDLYYDPKMHGVDWEQIHRKYLGQLAMVGSRQDLSRLLGDMLSELSTGHCYVGDPSGNRRVAYGYLGADFEAAPGQAAWKISKLLRGDEFNPAQRSPLATPGVDVHVGDYIVAIDGRPVDPKRDIQGMLIGTADQVVAIAVNTTPTMSGARIVYVKPLPSERELRYEDWVEGRRAYVASHGGANLGYVHIPDMMEQGAIAFQKGVLNNVLKDGVIYDTRYNGGGFIGPILEETMVARPIDWFQVRNGTSWTSENWANIGYKAAICNEFNFSNGELFCEVWKRMKIGPLVGHVTGGGLVGSGGGYRLVDNGTIYVPDYGAFVEGEWLVEGRGATPDVAVDNDPGDVIAGRDPQLDKTIELLEKQIAANPPRKPVHPPFRVLPPLKAGPG